MRVGASSNACSFSRSRVSREASIYTSRIGSSAVAITRPISADASGRAVRDAARRFGDTVVDVYLCDTESPLQASGGEAGETEGGT